ncbi:MAG: AEC family transporter [Clostridia bacterium]|nr:AEC family transporter [Clostridia bacterium]
MSFTVTLTAVAVMLLYAVPGFLLIKTKLVKSEHIPSFSKLLLFVCQPCLTIYSFGKVSFSLESLKNLGICFLITLVLQLGMIMLYFFLFRKKRNDIIWRIINLAAVLSNCGFLGVPVLEALLPDHPEALAYSSIFAITMNLIGWSVGMYIISLDKSYIKPRKMLLNPGTVGFAVALVMYFFSIKLPMQLDSMLTLLGRMSTPLCMIIMGMRLATANIKQVFCDPRQYLAVVLNQIAMPFIAFGIMYFLPISPILKTAVVILSSCPVASMVQNYAEIIGQGNDKGANMVLLGTMTSIVTVPLICLIL